MPPPQCYAILVWQGLQAPAVRAEQVGQIAHAEVFLRSVQAEGKIILGLAGMTDEEVDRVCQTCSKSVLAPFYFSRWWPMARETIQWVGYPLPLILRDGKLIRWLTSEGRRRDGIFGRC